MDKRIDGYKDMAKCPTCKKLIYLIPHKIIADQWRHKTLQEDFDCFNSVKTTNYVVVKDE